MDRNGRSGRNRGGTHYRRADDESGREVPLRRSQSGKGNGGMQPDRREIENQPRRSGAYSHPGRSAADGQPRRSSAYSQPGRSAADGQPRRSGGNSQPGRGASDNESGRKTAGSRQNRSISVNENRKRGSGTRPKRHMDNRRPGSTGSERRPQKRRRKKKKQFKFSFMSAFLVLVILAGLVAIGSQIMEKKSSQEENGTEAVAETADAGPVKDTEIPEETVVSQVDLVMVGDILLHDKVEEYCLESNGSYNYSSFFTNLETDITSADLALVSQEVIIGGRDLGVSGYPDFNAPNEMADDLVDAGFNVILHASNHAFDEGTTGITNCLTKWNRSYPDIAVLGIHDDEEDADEIYYYEKDGIKIAILNYTYGINGDRLPDSQSWMVDQLEETKVRADLEEARANADFVIVCPHWGTEYSLDIDESQEYWTNVFLEEGVDLVIGTHPHVIEAVKTFDNSATGGQMLVYYSLGNFVNWSSSTGSNVMNRFIGGMAKVTIGKTADGTVKITNHSTTALVCHVTSEVGGITVYKLSDYTKQLAKQNELCEQDPDFCINFAEKLCDRVWGTDWK